MGRHAQTGPSDARDDAQPLIWNSTGWQEYLFLELLPHIHDLRTASGKIALVVILSEAKNLSRFETQD